MNMTEVEVFRNAIMLFYGKKEVHHVANLRVKAEQKPAAQLKQQPQHEKNENRQLEDMGAKLKIMLGVGGKIPRDFMSWCAIQLKRINSSDDLTLLQFCFSLDDPMEICQYIATYLGSTPAISAFATTFIQRKKSIGKIQQPFQSSSAVPNENPKDAKVISNASSKQCMNLTTASKQMADSSIDDNAVAPKGDAIIEACRFAASGRRCFANEKKKCKYSHKDEDIKLLRSQTACYFLARHGHCKRKAVCEFNHSMTLIQAHRMEKNWFP